MKELLSSIFGTAFSTIATIVDEVVTSKEEKEALKIKLIEIQQKHIEEIAKLSIEQQKIETENLKDARQSNVEIQTSEKVPLLAKYTPYIIDLFTTAIWAVCVIIVLLKAFNPSIVDKVDMSLVLAVLTGVTGQFTTILGFHRGSSTAIRQ